MSLSTSPSLLDINFFFQAEDGIRDSSVTGVQTCALPISLPTNHDRFRFDITGDNVGDLSKKSVAPAFDVGFRARSTSTLGNADLALFYYGGASVPPPFRLDPRPPPPRPTALAIPPLSGAR